MTTSDVPLSTKIYADGADLPGLLALVANPMVSGFTTNPSLMLKSGVSHYEEFARQVLDVVGDRPVSFEILSDELHEMYSEAFEISSWAPNVFVKVPVTNTRREPTTSIVRELSASGVQVNVTALMTVGQVERVTAALDGGAPSNVSVFAGRIADTGRDPVATMRAALAVVRAVPTIELIWASPREILNVVQASEMGCHIITVTYDLVAKLPLLGKDLEEFSLDTVRMFHRDAQSAGLTLAPTA